MCVINSDSTDVEKTLLNMISLLEEKGAYIDKEIVFNFSSGSYYVSSTSGVDEENERLLFIPDSCLIPIDLFKLELNAGHISITDVDNKATNTQIKLMELQLDLYNFANKIQQACMASHRFSLGEDHPISKKIESLRTIRSPYKYSALNSDSNLADPNAQIELLLSQYKMTHTDHSVGCILMPLILLLNHHDEGAGYCLDADGVSINCSRPNRYSDECFAYYGGGKDALIHYFLYQYYDKDKNFAYCVPQKISLPNNLGSIVIKAEPHIPGKSINSQLPKYSTSGNIVTCNFLKASSDPKSNILDICIPLFIQHLDPMSMRPEVISSVKNTILENSIKYYRELELMIAEEPVTEKNKLVLPILKDISKHQIGIFERSRV